MPFILNLMVACLAAFGLSVVAGAIVVRLEERGAVSQPSSKKGHSAPVARHFSTRRLQAPIAPSFRPEEHEHVA